MNQMRIPRLLRAMTWLSIPVLIISLAGWWWLSHTPRAALPDGFNALYPALVTMAEFLCGLAFVLMLTAYSLSLLFDAILNGLLRRYGQPATATILARHNTGIRTGTWSHLWRLTLRVEPADGAAFEAITEDTGGGGRVGDQVPVRYDRRTKTVALERPWAKHPYRSTGPNF